jgi:heme/copper-type cytochrome/quinol oxidase subunit 3
VFSLDRDRLWAWIFLATEAALVAGLFAAYFRLRAGSITWGWSPHRHLALINSAILFASTGCFAAAVAAVRRGHPAVFRRLTTATLVLAAIFLAVKGYEYQDDVALALYPRTSTRIGLYYLTTAVLAAHVVGGMIVTAWLARTPPPMRAHRRFGRAELTLLYWTFIDIVWIVLVVFFYVW